jgi:competence protein ComEA
MGKNLWMRRSCCLFIGLLTLVMIPGISSAQGKPDKVAKSLVDLNTASEKELEELKGVGPSAAKKIIAGRPYKSVDDLKKAGIPEKTIEAIRPLVTVSSKSGPAASAGKEAMKVSPPAGPAPKMVSKEAPGKGPVGLIDINSADSNLLETLPGIGPSTAKEIIRGRPYWSIDELAKVKGIGKAKLESLRDKITVGPSAGGPSAGPLGKTPSPPTVSPGKERTGPAKTPVAGTGPTPVGKISGQKINLNTASKEELDALPGIGPVKAQAIIDGRPYKKPEDIMKVKGIKEGVYEKIKDRITVE